jgi:hypothetical protein
MSRLRDKFTGSIIRLLDAFRLFPLRSKRLFLHFSKNIKFKKPLYLSIGMWWSELLYLILDLCAIPEIYETVQDWFKFNTRTLTPFEIQVARSIFGDSINYQRVRIDEKAQIGCRHFHFLYVSFYTINSWGAFREDLLIHELVHVWQFQNFGGAYIPRAIRAINSEAGYNYGGIYDLRQKVRLGKNILEYNYEQQADIVTDYFRLKHGHKPQWGSATQYDLEIYEKICEFVKGSLVGQRGKEP